MTELKEEFPNVPMTFTDADLDEILHTLDTIGHHPDAIDAINYLRTERHRCAKIAADAAISDRDYADKYPDEASRYIERSHRAHTIAVAILREPQAVSE